MRETMKSNDLTSDNLVLLNAFSPKKPRDKFTVKNQCNLKPNIRSNLSTKGGNLHEINYHNSTEFIEGEKDS